MDKRIRDIYSRIRELEDEIDEIIRERHARFRYEVKKHRVRFEADVRRHHRRLKRGLISFFRRTHFWSLVSAPVIYALIIPLVLLDLMLVLYQHTCMRAYGIPRVPRRDYIAIDRHHLAYLNAIEKLNCVYCSYANGLIAWAREIAARTEQYWCPIKHAIRVKGAHRRHAGFVDYGDAEGYRQKLADLRKAVQKAE